MCIKAFILSEYSVFEQLNSDYAIFFTGLKHMQYSIRYPCKYDQEPDAQADVISFKKYFLEYFF